MLPTAMLGFLIIFTMAAGNRDMYQKAVKDQRYIKGRQGEGQLAELSAVKRFVAASILLVVGMLGDFVLL